MPLGDAGMLLPISGIWRLFLGATFCPIRLASVQDCWKLRYSQTAWEGAWASQQLNHLCVPPCDFHCPGRPSQQQGWWVAAHSITCQDTQHTRMPSRRRDRLSQHCFSSWEISSVQRNPHLALRPTLSLMNRLEDLAHQNELYVTKCTLVFYPRSHSSFP